MAAASERTGEQISVVPIYHKTEKQNSQYHGHILAFAVY